MSRTSARLSTALLGAGVMVVATLASFPAAAKLAPTSTLAPDPSARKVMAALNLLDADGKGYVTADDFLRGRAFAGRVFTLLDRNGDGVIDRREFVAGGDGLRSSEFSRLDRKKDGRVTHAEFLRGWNLDLFYALSHDRPMLTANDLRPDFGSVRLPQPSAQPEEVAAIAPTVSSGAVCWVPVLADGRHWHWSMIFPWTPLCP